MKVVLTVSTWNFKHLPEYASARSAIEEVRSLGLVPELWLNWDTQADFYDRPNWPQVRELAGHSQALSLHTRNDRRRMLEEIELLAYLGGRVLVVHPIVLSLADWPEQRPDIPFVRELADAARQAGVLLGLENIHGRNFLDQVLQQVPTFDARGGLGICIDIGHAELRRDEVGESAVDLIRDYGGVLLHLHVHDVRQQADHQPLGEGRIDYAAIAQALRRANFQGTAALEIQAPDPVKTVRAGLDYLRRCFGPDLET